MYMRVITLSTYGYRWTILSGPHYRGTSLIKSTFAATQWTFVTADLYILHFAFVAAGLYIFALFRDTLLMKKNAFR